MMKIVIAIIAVFLVSLSLFGLKECRQFFDPLYFSAYDTSLKLVDAINNDTGFAPNTVRIFHNKLALGAMLIFDRYISFFDIKFALPVFSPIGYFGVWAGFLYLFKLRSKLKWLLAAFFLLLPFLEVFRFIEPFRVRFVSVFLPYLLLSAFGLWMFALRGKWRKMLCLVVLIVISIWYMYIFNPDILLNCA
jgi:hypothetical protein